MAHEHLDVWEPPKPLVAAHSSFIYYSGLFGVVGWAAGAGVSALIGKGAISKHAELVGTVVGIGSGLLYAHQAYEKTMAAKLRHEGRLAEWHEAQRER